MVDERILNRIPKLYRGFIEVAELPDRASKWRGEPSFLIFLGANGVGKSSMAARTVVEFAKDRPPFNLVWVNCATLGADLRNEIAHPPDHGPGLVQRITDATLLVLDDMVSNRPTEYITETLRHVLCHRYDNLMPTIITAEDLNRIEDRLKSRLAEGLIVQVEGEDKRRRQHAGGTIRAVG